MLRPGDQAFFDILQSFMGYRTCYYRTFNVGRATPVQHDAYTKAREWLDAAIALIKPGVTTDKVCSVWPRAPDFGFPDEMAAFGLQFGHGLGLALHERPIISRVVSLEHPTEIKEGMVFALETYCPATDGYSAARIEPGSRCANRACADGAAGSRAGDTRATRGLRRRRDALVQPVRSQCAAHHRLHGAASALSEPALSGGVLWRGQEEGQAHRSVM